MTPSRSLTSYALLTLVLAALALRPVPAVERLLDFALLPTRALAELAAPIGWVQGREALAGGDERKLQQRRELFEHEALEMAVLESAISERSSEHETAEYVHAEVIGRPSNARDTILVRVQDARGMEVGLPVVTGDWFVGLVTRVVSVDEASTQLEVQLITGSKARIAARVEAGPASPDVELVVGGVAPPAGQVYLDVHNPSHRWVHEGAVVVAEPKLLGERFSHLADGYRLGDLVLTTLDGGQTGQQTLTCILPGLDFESGLYQVLVLRPRTGLRAPAAEGARKQNVLEDEHWAQARLFLRSEPSPWREGRKLALGRRHGVKGGAALASGARLVGRVQHAGPWLSDVRMVGDPGFSVVVLAMVEVPSESGDEIVPHVMGRVTSRGRDAQGAIRLEWTATLPLPGEGVRNARLWTGSGEEGVPRGLLLGDARLPCGPGTHELSLLQPEGAREPKGLRVRMEAGP